MMEQTESPEKCQSCKINPAEELHTCPYLEELYGNETLCNCCSECEHDCIIAI